MIRRLLGAFQFLTVLPVHCATASPARSSAFFPLAGAALGALACLAYLGAAAVFPVPLAALLPLAVLVIATGGLHEDGLSDVADAVRAGRTRQRMLAIMKDSRIGAYGALAIGLSLLFRWQALAAIPGAAPWRLIPAVVLSRSVMVLLAAVSRPAGEGLGKSFCMEVRHSDALAALAIGAPFLLVIGWRTAIVLVAINGVLLLAARAYFHRRLGGLTGDCLGAAAQVSEICSLLVIAQSGLASI